MARRRSALAAASPLLDQSEFDAAQAALALAISNETQANAADAQISTSQGAANSAATADAFASSEALFERLLAQGLPAR